MGDVKKRNDYCEKGTRRNKQTGKCDCNPGTRRNPKTNLCEPILSDRSAVTIKKRRAYCPKGTRRNKITGKCEKDGTDSVVSEVVEDSSAAVSETPTEAPPIRVKEVSQIASDIAESSPIDTPDDNYVDTAVSDSQTASSSDSAPVNIASDTTDADIMALAQPADQSDANLARQMEKREYDLNRDASGNLDFLYPTLNDPNFIVKIASKKEFNDTQYDGDARDIQKHADSLCTLPFELSAHQLFVKNFLSFQTPYNSLLLYHGLGTGKTCSAIGIAEEFREYLKQMSIGAQKYVERDTRALPVSKELDATKYTQGIIIIASPNVQDNFKLQLFDESKLKEINGDWNLSTCVGNALLKEINPTNLKGLKRDRVIKSINAIISTYYLFHGYIQFYNYVINVTEVSSDITAKEKDKQKIGRIKRFFNNRLIVIDEVHNIRISDDSNIKKVATKLAELATHTDTLRFLFLSGTPMYDKYREIIWIVNLMNTNDKRPAIRETDVFNLDTGEFKTSSNPAIESGEQLLRRKLTGYVSYVRGENPYLFPYRIYPDIFAPENSFDSPKITQPTIQLNLVTIKPEARLKYLKIYVTQIGSYQERGYQLLLQQLLEKQSHQISQLLDDNITSSGVGYHALLPLIQSLNIVYPSTDIDDNDANLYSEYDNSDEVNDYDIGSKGLHNVMIEDKHTKKFDYKPDIYEKYGRLFHEEHIHKYSSKIHEMCNIIRKSTGIILIYSQFISSGLVPMALALEEMGFSKFSSKTNANASLFSKQHHARHKVKPFNVSGNPNSTVAAKYIMITGDARYSADNDQDVKYVTTDANKTGNLIKVVLISKAGAEGLDFKNLRQIHIMDPWYNMNRNEQIIGRGVRNLSHCKLPFNERTVEIYMHATVLSADTTQECADIYMYRLSEKKAVQIGKVARLIKQTAVDCILNLKQTHLTVEKLNKLAENQNIMLKLSDGTDINFKIGDRPYTDICDYMSTCEYQCMPTKDIKEADIVTETYNNDFVKMNTNILTRIQNLFKDSKSPFFYKRDYLIKYINQVKQYPIEQIFYVLTDLIKNKNNMLVDKNKRVGNLVNRGEYYIFQPVEINNKHASIYEYSTPVDFKHTYVKIELSKQLSKNAVAANQTATSVTYRDLFADVSKIIASLFSPAANTQPHNLWNWYDYLKRVMYILTDLYGLTAADITTYTTYHFLDSLQLNEKITLATHIYASRAEPPASHSNIYATIKAYFDAKTFNTRDNMLGLYLTKDNMPIVFIHKNNAWVESEPEDYVANDLLKFNVDIHRHLFVYVGFFATFKGNFATFKVKDMSNARAFGTNIYQSQKPVLLAFINKINGANHIPPFTIDNSNGIPQQGLFAILEFIMRHYSALNPDKIMFLSSEVAFKNLSDKIK